MALILARSPFFVANEGLDRDATLTVDLERIDDDALNTTILKTYVLTYSRQTEIDISGLLLPYLRSEGKPIRVKTSVEGLSNEMPQSPVVNYHVACDGYAYHQEGYNYDASSDLIANCYYTGSTDCVYYLDDTAIRLPFLSPTTSSNQIDDVNVDFYLMKSNEIIRNGTISMSSEFNQFRLIFNSQGLTHLDFENRISFGGGTFEDNKCNREFFDKYSIEGIDNIRFYDSATGNIKDIKVVPIEECKYDPYRVVFINKYGLQEDLWFFKRSDKSMSVTREQYRANVFDSYKAGNKSNHVYSNFNITGRESMILNSGFVPEEFYEAFKQMYLSEQVWIYLDKTGAKTPVNVKNTDLTQKLHKNEKVINYEVELEFAFDTIGNVV